MARLWSRTACCPKNQKQASELQRKLERPTEHHAEDRDDDAEMQKEITEREKIRGDKEIRQYKIEDHECNAK